MASVWNEEVYAGLIKEIQKTVKIKNAKKELILLPQPKKAIIVRKPEEDLKFEVYPCISLFIKDTYHDAMRYNPQPVKRERDPATHRIIVEEQAVPYNLAMQMDFWAKYEEDLDNMTRTWLFRHFRQFNLAVVDDGGTPRSVNVLSSRRAVRADLTLGKERLFHSVLNYSIWVEIDDEMRYDVPMVTQVQVNTKS